MVVYLKNYAMSPLNVNLSVYVKSDLIIAILIDDFLITSGSISKIKVAKVEFHASFKMFDLWFYKYYWGMTVTRDYKNQILWLG